MAHCPADAGLTREALSRMLSGTGNPEVRSLRAILQAGGLTLTFQPQTKQFAA